MMKLRSALEYMTGADFITARISEENTRLLEVTGSEHAMPLDEGPKLTMEVYGRRLQTLVEHTGIIACRLTGIELVTRPFRNQK